MGIRETFGRIKKSVEDKAGEIKKEVANKASEIKQKVQDKESKKKKKNKALENLEELIKKLKEKKKTALDDLMKLGLIEKIDTESETNSDIKLTVDLSKYTNESMAPEFIKKLFDKSMDDFKKLLLAIRKKEEAIQNLQFKINYGISKYNNGNHYTVSEITEATKISENAIKEYDTSISVKNLPEKLDIIKNNLLITQKYIELVISDFK